MKLVYDNLVIGSLSDIICDMNREGGALDLLPVHEREPSELSEQRFKWVEISGRLEELEIVLDKEEYESNSEVEKLWKPYEKLPDSENHDCWKLLNEETGETESINFPRFSQGGADWGLNIPKSEKEKRISAVLPINWLGVSCNLDVH